LLESWSGAHAVRESTEEQEFDIQDQKSIDLNKQATSLEQGQAVSDPGPRKQVVEGMTAVGAVSLAPELPHRDSTRPVDGVGLTIFWLRPYGEE